MKIQQSSPHFPEGSPYARHIPALDGIRGLAVLAVMGSHLFPCTARNAVTRVLGGILAYGATGVDLFFVLSGFLITGILFDSLEDPYFFRKFYARRVLRIFPLYYGILIAYALGALLFGMRFDGQLMSLALYMQNTHLISRPIYAYAGPSLLPLSHFWSLAIEEQFYLVWPLVVFFLRSRYRLLLVCLVFTLICPMLRAALWIKGWTYYSVHQNTILRADSLLAGGALALILRSPAHKRMLRAAPWLAMAGALAALGIIFMPALPGSAQRWWPSLSLSLRYTSFDLLYTGLIALALTPSLVQRICRVSILRSLGKYSYGLYVFHLLLFGYLMQPVRSVIAHYLTSNKAVGVALTGIIGFAVSLLAAVVSFQFYERPFLRMKKFFSYHYQVAPAERPPAHASGAE